eukprot:gb/GECG01012931.1/.p1 GENE.gb/GECG01012931.1/~~gb/GECG01012931.1/.p1  ORF type:complete len:113 (+),score=7.76 gb/GECG01012931.1/:1-339(+)
MGRRFASKGLAYFLWFPLGILGLHRFYVGRWKSGLLWMFTGGFFVVGWLYDFLLIPDFVEEFNQFSLRENTLETGGALLFQSDHFQPMGGFDNEYEQFQEAPHLGQGRKGMA